jgi:hypothetical protein
MVHIIIIIVVMMFERAHHARVLRNYKKLTTRIIYQQMLRWYKKAREANHPADRVLFINYAVGHLKTLHELSSDEEIREVLGPSIDEISREIKDFEYRVAKQFYSSCPEIFSSRVVPI